MERDEILSKKSPREEEIDRLSRFPDIPFARRPSSSGLHAPGVLLGDEIEFYCKNYRLLSPYEPRNIKAANYELRVGLRYSVGGKRHTLKIGESLTIPRFEVAVIEILETVNVPAFLIGRWNIRTRWAYKGLIWVGGPQVDAGYRGLLMCPLWNLSTEDFTIKCGDAIAVIDFIATTPPTSRSKDYEYAWDKRSRFIFDEYEPEKLKSGLVEEAIQKINAVESRQSETEKNLERNRDRMDGVTGLMFTALAVLTTAIAVIVTKEGNHAKHFWEQSMFWLSSGTLLIALLAWAKARSASKIWTGIEIFFLLVMASAIATQIYQVHLQSKDVEQSASTVRSLRERVDHLQQEQIKLERLLKHGRPALGNNRARSAPH